MPIKVHGVTDVSSVSMGALKTSKAVCIVGLADTGVTTTENTPFLISSITDAIAKFGPKSIGAQLATLLFKGGVSAVYGVVPTKPSADTDIPAKYDAALTTLLRYPDIKIIITDSVLPTVIAKVGAHLTLAESQDIFRYGCVGIDSSDLTALSTQAASTNSKRIFMAGPRTLNGDTNNPQSGIYSAAGLAALIATETNDPALPMNGVEMVGFSGVETILLTTEKDALVNAGVVPLYNSPAGNPTVYRLVTTYTKDTQGDADPTWQEGTTIFITDDVLSACQSIIRTNYKRTKNVARILKSMRTDIITVLQTKNDLEIIQNFDPNTVSVVKDPNDAYGALIDYTYDVVTPLYTVTITQHMKL